MLWLRVAASAIRPYKGFWGLYEAKPGVYISVLGLRIQDHAGLGDSACFVFHILGHVEQMLRFWDVSEGLFADLNSQGPR